MQKYLIINPFGIGDVLFTTPVIKALKKKHPDCFIGYWCNERVGELLRGEPRIDRVFALSRGDIKRTYKSSLLKRMKALLGLINDIRREKFNIVFDYSLDSRYGLWSKLAGIKRRIGLDYRKRGRFLTDKVGLNDHAGRHIIERNLELLRFIDIEPLDKSLELVISEEDKAKARRTLKERAVTPTDNLIGVAPGGGASWGENAIYKQWPAEKFGQLAGMLIKDPNIRIVLLGNEEDRPLSECVSRVARVIDFTGKLNLIELTAIMSELKLLVCNDGGPLHMAVALGVSTVSVFGPVDEKVYGPYPPSAKHIAVKKDMSCRPCYKDNRFDGCTNDKKCLEGITVDEVFEKVRNSL